MGDNAKVADETVWVPLPREYTCWPADGVGNELPVFAHTDQDEYVLVGFIRKQDFEAVRKPFTYDARPFPRRGG